MYAQDEDSGLMTEQAQMESESKRCHHLCPQQRKSSSIPLLLLVKQILKNAGFQTTGKANFWLKISSLGGDELIVSWTSLFLIQQCPF